MSAEVTPIEQDEPEGQLADVIELYPDDRSFWERNGRIVRNWTVGAVVVGAALYVGYEIVDYAAADMAEKVMEGVKPTK